MITKLKSFIKECIRVFKITKKPKSTEFKMIVKVTAIGALIIGLLGFIIHLIWQLVR